MNNTSTVNTSTDTADHVPDPAEAMATYYTQTRRTQMNLSVISRVPYLAWGAAWLIGFGALWISGRSLNGEPSTWAIIVFDLCIMAGWIISVVIGIRATKGMRNVSGTSGAIYGWAWGLSFVAGIFMMNSFCHVYNIVPAGIAVLNMSVSALLVGTLMIAGAAFWPNRSMVIIGTLMLVLCILGVVVAVPTGYLVMALAGGGGMLIAFAEETWRIHRLAARAAE
jgi:uncharacterized membrane protein (DUF485 family)